MRSRNRELLRARQGRHRRLLAGLGAAVMLAASSGAARMDQLPETYVVMGFNDLGMHCMQEDFSQFMLLPPFNNLHAQVIRRGEEPDIIHNGVTVDYTIPSNTRSSDKTNFWTYVQGLMGVTLPPNVGLTGNTMAGTMTNTPNEDWEATGIPATPIEDTGRENSYPLATINVWNQGSVVATTQAVVPVSWEISCNLCHDTPGITTATDILRSHDSLHGTNLEQSQPVFCATCHADPVLGEPGIPGVPSLSGAIHTAHAPRMDQLPFELDVECYACHPGRRTQCQRDVHLGEGLDCLSCHDSMEAVGSPSRTSWVDEPRCGDCHSRSGFDFEQPGKLFRESVGHGGVMCMTCHGSPHAITPTVTGVDNLQAINLQGHPGVLNGCTVCHTQMPDDDFFHKIDD